MKQPRVAATVVLVASGVFLATFGSLTAQEDPALGLWESFRSLYDRLPPVPDDPDVCVFMNTRNHVRAAERLFAYIQLTGHEDRDLQEALDYLESVASGDCEVADASVSGRCSEGGSCSGGYSPRAKPEPAASPRRSGGASSEELEAARTRIAELERALDDERSLRARVDQQAVASREAGQEALAEAQARIAELEGQLSWANDARAREREASEGLRERIRAYERGVSGVCQPYTCIANPREEPFAIGSHELGVVISARPDAAVRVLTLDAARADPAGTRFRVRSGLADRYKVTLESLDYPGYYLRHSSFRLYLSRDDGSAIFREDATFMWHSMDGMSSFQSHNYPGRWIRVAGGGVTLDEFDDGMASRPPGIALQFLKTDGG